MCFGQTIVLKVKKIYLVIEQVILMKTENQHFFFTNMTFTSKRWWCDIPYEL